MVSGRQFPYSGEARYQDGGMEIGSVVVSRRTPVALYAAQYSIGSNQPQSFMKTKLGLFVRAGYTRSSIESLLIAGRSDATRGVQHQLNHHIVESSYERHGTKEERQEESAEDAQGKESGKSCKEGSPQLKGGSWALLQAGDPREAGRNGRR